MRRQEKLSTKGLGLRGKLLLLLLLVGLVPFLVNAIVDQIQAASALGARAAFQLESVRELKRNQIVRYLRESYAGLNLMAQVVLQLRTDGIARMKGFEGTEKQTDERFLSKRFADAKVFAASLSTVSAVHELGQAFAKEGKKVGGSMWNGYRDKHGPLFKAFTEAHGSYDLLLLNADGDVLYAVAEKSDLGQNVARGGLKDSPLGRLFPKALKEASMEDHAPYGPSGNQQSVFLGTPVKSGGRVLGVLVVVQLSSSDINDIVQEREGLDASFDLLGKYQKAYGHYDVYLVSPDGYCYHSVKKDKDYQTNFFTGEYRDTSLGKLLRSVAERKQTQMSDYAEYAPGRQQAAGLHGRSSARPGRAGVHLSDQQRHPGLHGRKDRSGRVGRDLHSGRGLSGPHQLPAGLEAVRIQGQDRAVKDAFNQEAGVIRQALDWRGV